MSYNSEDAASFVESDEGHLERLIARSTKRSSYINPSMVLDLKTRKRQGKCVGAASEVKKVIAKQEESKKYDYICDTIWYLLADYIEPEDVQSYALICRQSANSIVYCEYWKKLYLRYCQRSNNSKRWILNLPERLQQHNIQRGNVRCIRHSVIQSLFYCYRPFIKRTRQSLKLDSLIGRTFMRSWVIHSSHHFITYVELKLLFAFPKKLVSAEPKSLPHKLVDNWEELANDDNDIDTNDQLLIMSSLVHESEGVCLLLLCSTNLAPVLSHMQYDKNSNRRVRLHKTRALLSSDMKTTNLEFDFIYNFGNEVITIRCPNVLWFKVIPWWHPDYYSYKDSIVE
uniref:Transmembrane protein 183 n=1 Tax=Glossina brevipalpis TaxID=37001 RepID=A0A1A9X2Z6_9MUSC